MRTIVWWTVWGLVVSAGIIGLLEAPYHHARLLLSLPLLTGATAAAFLRIQYEYHHAIQHAKWMAMSSLFLMCGLGYLYAKANAYGPFATGTAHKAFLGTTFEMSVPEVERAIGRRLTPDIAEKPYSERAQAWIVEALPLPGRPEEERFVLPLSLYHVPCNVSFFFRRSRLGEVRVEFDPLPAIELDTLLGQIRGELGKEYKRDSDELYLKEDVQATIETIPAASRSIRSAISLKYLPFVEAVPAPLAVESNAF